VLGYGRSIRPYGDSAFMEVLTAAANAGALSAQEMQVAYSFIYKAAIGSTHSGTTRAIAR
jgi:hypothetical protein